MNKTLYKNARILTMDKSCELIDGAMLVGDGKILYLGSDNGAPAADNVFDCGGDLLMPSFINSHTHSPMTLFRGYAEGKNLQQWLFEYIFPIESRLDSDAVYWGTMMALAEQARNGITLSNDMYFFSQDIARAVLDSGCKMNICRCVSCDTELESYSDYPSIVESVELIRKYRGNPYIKPVCSVHSEYTTNPSILREVLEIAKRYDVSIDLHIDETALEHEMCIERHGMTPVEYFDNLGFFERPVNLAHAVHLNENDINILMGKRVSIIHCPVSNLKLASGIAPIPAILQRGINVALGTDSATSNNSLNILEEVKLAATLHKGISGKADCISSAQALQMATTNGAAALGRMKECGRLEVGYDADFLLVDYHAAEFYPRFNPIDAIVFAMTNRNIKMTVCKGRVLYKDGEYTAFDFDEIRCGFNQAVKRLYN